MPCCRGPEVTGTRERLPHGTPEPHRRTSTPFNPAMGAQVAEALNRAYRDQIERLCLSEAL